MDNNSNGISRHVPRISVRERSTVENAEYCQTHFPRSIEFNYNTTSFNLLLIFHNDYNYSKIICILWSYVNQGRFTIFLPPMGLGGGGGGGTTTPGYVSSDSTGFQWSL